MVFLVRVILLMEPVRPVSQALSPLLPPGVICLSCFPFAQGEFLGQLFLVCFIHPPTLLLMYSLILPNLFPSYTDELCPAPFLPTKLQGISQEGGDGKWLNALRIKMKPGGLRVTAGGIPSLCLLELTCNPHDGSATIPGPPPPPVRTGLSLA